MQQAGLTIGFLATSIGGEVSIEDLISVAVASCKESSLVTPDLQHRVRQHAPMDCDQNDPITSLCLAVLDRMCSSRK